MTEFQEILLPHQRQLVEEFRLRSAPQAVVLDAPTGTGKSHALAVVAAERAEQGDLVIVVTPRALVSQWAMQLALAGSAPAAIYASPADFRMSFDSLPSPWPASGVVLCAPSVLRTPLVAKTLATTRPSLLIADDVAPAAGSAVGRSLRSLADRAAQVIVTAGGGANRWFQEGEVRRWTYPLVDNAGREIGPRFSHRVHEYEGDGVEAGVVQEALGLLDRIGYPFPHALLTRPAIQAAMLGVVRRIEAPEQLPLWEEGQMELDLEQGWEPAVDRAVVESLWTVLDRFDELAADARLAAVLDETVSGRRDGRPVVVLCDRLREVDYIVAALDSAPIPVVTVTGQAALEERDEAMGRFSDGSVLVVTSVFFSMQRGLPDGTRSIWFTPPRSPLQARQRLGLGVTSSGVEIVLLKATPPTTPADELVDRLTGFLENPWSEPEGLLTDDT